MKDCSCPVTCPLSEVGGVNAAVFLCACLWGQPNRERNTFAVSKQLFKLLIIVVVIKRGKKKRGEKELETSPPEVQGLIIQGHFLFLSPLPSHFLPGSQVLTVLLSVTARKREGIIHYTNYIISQKENKMLSILVSMIKTSMDFMLFKP